MGGLVLSRLQQMLFASSKNFNSSFLTAAILLLGGAGLTLLLRPRTPKSERTVGLVPVEGARS